MTNSDAKMLLLGLGDSFQIFFLEIKLGGIRAGSSYWLCYAITVWCGNWHRRVKLVYMRLLSKTFLNGMVLKQTLFQMLC